MRYVLEGSVRKADNQVRITAQLIDATTGGHLWSERYDRPLKDIFALQDEIVQKIVTTLKLQLTLAGARIDVRKHTNNLEAYDYFLRGMESDLDASRKRPMRRRGRCLRQAIELGPAVCGGIRVAELDLLAGVVLQWSRRSPDPGAGFCTGAKGPCLG